MSFQRWEVRWNGIYRWAVLFDYQNLIAPMIDGIFRFRKSLFHNRLKWVNKPQP
jgi:N-acyl-L-homoserine lactone synthetase